MRKICLAALILIHLNSNYLINPSQAKVQKIKVTSTAFENKGFIPDEHACEYIGADRSPNLSFSNIPDGTQSFALIMFDPDAPDKNFVHWIIFNIPVSTPGLEADIPRDAVLENSIKQGTNGAQRIGYFGPCPPPRETHNYVFNIFALDTVLNLEGGANKNQLLKAMNGHITGKGKIVGLYKNKTNN